jgi:hypothetical protein
MMTRLLVTSAVLSLFVVAPAAAGLRHPDSIDARQHRQAARIADGARSGQLTVREARSLRAQERALAREERVYRRDGLRPWERRDLQRDLNRLNRRISRQKHDGQQRPR